MHIVKGRQGPQKNDMSLIVTGHRYFGGGKFSVDTNSTHYFLYKHLNKQKPPSTFKGKSETDPSHRSYTVKIHLVTDGKIKTQECNEDFKATKLLPGNARAQTLLSCPIMSRYLYTLDNHVSWLSSLPSFPPCIIFSVLCSRKLLTEQSTHRYFDCNCPINL